MMLVDPFRFAGTNPATLEFVQSDLLSTLPGTETKISISNYPIGSPRDDRRAFVVLHIFSPVPLTDAIGGNVSGVPMAIHIQQRIIYAGVQQYHGLSMIASSHVVGGATGDIEIEFAAAVNGVPLVATYRATDLRSDVAHDARGMIGNTPQREYPMDIATPKDGILIAAGTVRLAGTGGEILGTTTQYSETFVGYGQFGGGDATMDDPSHHLTFRMIGGESFQTMEGAFVAASFR